MGTKAVCASVLCFKGSLSFQDLKKHPWAPERLLGNDTFGCWAEIRILVGGSSLDFVWNLCAPLHLTHIIIPFKRVSITLFRGKV